MSLALEDSWTKHARGVEHLQTLAAECDTYLREAVFSVESISPGPDGVEPRFNVEPSPPRRFGAMVGDVAHNLRSALDVAAWQLAVAKDEDAARRQPNLVQFPLASTLDGFQGERVQRTLSFFGESARIVIERLQPYQPSTEALGWLRDISNSDKHRIATFSFTGLTANLDDGEVGVTTFSGPHLLFGTDEGRIGLTGLQAVAVTVEAALAELEEKA